MATQEKLISIIILASYFRGESGWQCACQIVQPFFIRCDADTPLILLELGWLARTEDLVRGFSFEASVIPLLSCADCTHLFLSCACHDLSFPHLNKTECSCHRITLCSCTSSRCWLPTVGRPQWQIKDEREIWAVKVWCVWVSSSA